MTNPEIIVDTDYINARKSRYDRSACGYNPSVTESYQIAERSQTTSTKWEPEHRVRPTELFNSFTGLGQRYRITRRTGEYERTTTKTCGWGGGYPAILTEWKRLFPTTSVSPTLVLPPWELDMLLKIKDHAINISENIGEWREAVDYLHTGATILKKTIRAYQRFRRNPLGYLSSRPKAFQKRLDKNPIADAIGADLSVTFGVMPVIGQIVDVMDHLHRLDPKFSRFVVTKSVTGFEEAAGLYGGSCSHAIKMSSRTIVYVDFITQADGIAPINVPEAIWAGIGFSFMVDYFIGVGDWLAAFSALKDIRHLGGTTTYKTSEVLKDDRSLVDWTTVTGGSITTQRFSRGVVQSIAIPPFPARKNSATLRKLQLASEILYTLRQ